MDDFGRVLPPTITDSAVRSGNEWVIPFPGVMQAIGLATEHEIAILGVEAFRIAEVGLSCVGYSGYEFECRDDWDKFVRENNEAATRFVEESAQTENLGYILTTSSQREFTKLRARR